MGKTALLFGATGLVGSYLKKLIEEDQEYSVLKVFVRHEQPSTFKTEVIRTDFENLWKTESHIKGDVLFCCLGTTIKTAGNKEAFRKVDYDFVLKIGEYAKRNGVSHFIVISSIGANESSNNFYLKTKGEMEEALINLGFNRLSILRPSILLGPRREFRLGESIGKVIIRMLSPLLPKKFEKYKGIHAAVLSTAMLEIDKSESNQSLKIYESDLLLQLGKKGTMKM